MIRALCLAAIILLFVAGVIIAITVWQGQAVPTMPPATVQPTPPEPAWTPSPAPTPTPTWHQWLGDQIAITRCQYPGDTMVYRNERRRPPYHADFYCKAPTPTQDAVATKVAATIAARPTATPLIRTPTERRPTAMLGPPTTARHTPTRPRPSPTLWLPTAQPELLAGAVALQEQYEGVRLLAAVMTWKVRADKSEGSAFFLFEDDYWYLITNYHVIEGAKDIQVCWAVAQRCWDAWTVFEGEKYFDVAILDRDWSDWSGLENPLLQAWLAEVLSGFDGYIGYWGHKTSAVAAGYPGDWPAVRSDLAVDLPRVRTAAAAMYSYIIEREGEGGYSWPTMQFNASMGPGVSGGLVMRSDGRAIGLIACESDPEWTGSSAGIYNCAIPLQEVLGDD